MKDKGSKGKTGKSLEDCSPQMRKEIQKALKKRARRRRLVQVLCGLVAVGCFAPIVDEKHSGI